MNRLFVFGTLDLQIAAGSDVRSLLAQAKHAALLAYLVVGNRGLHRRERLAALLWPELDDARARNALSKAVHNIRRTLGDDVVQVRGNDAIGIDAERVWCDASAFDDAMTRGASEEALSLYQRGELLEGFRIDGSTDFEQWLDSARFRYRQAALDGATACADVAARSGDLAASVRWSRTALELSPHDETVFRRLLAHLVDSGDRAGALTAYRAFAERLQRELEVDPSGETRALVDAAREGDPRSNGSNGRTRNHQQTRTRDRDEPVLVSVPADVGLHALPPELLPGPASPAAPARGVRARWGTRRTVVTAALGVTAILLVVTRSLPLRAPAPSPTSAAGSGLVAVSALRVDSGDSTLRAVAGIATQGLVQQLAQSGTGVIDLRNTGTAGPEAPARTDAETRSDALGAGASRIVGGRVHATGDSVYVNLQITDARDGRVLHQFDQFASPASNSLLILGRMRDGVAGAVAALSDTLYLPWSTAHSRPPNFAAFGEFLRGLDAIVNEGTSTALGHFKAAIALDTTFAEAKIWALEQAMTLPSERQFMDSVRRSATAQRPGMLEFDRVSLDRVLAHADGRWDDAYGASRRLSRISPSTPDALLYLAQSAMATRRYEEAVSTLHRLMGMGKGWLAGLGQIRAWDLQAHRLLDDLPTAVAEWRQLRRAQPKYPGLCRLGLANLAAAGLEPAVDSLVGECMTGTRSPTSEQFWMQAGNAYRAYGHLPAARRAFDRALSADRAAPESERRSQRLRGEIESLLGDWRSAYANLRTAVDSADWNDRCLLAVAAAHVGDTSTVATTIRWIQGYGVREGLDDGQVEQSIASIVAAQGKKDEAITLLRQAVRRGAAPAWQGWRVRHDFDPLRNDPRFRALVQPVR